MWHFGRIDIDRAAGTTIPVLRRARLATRGLVRDIVRDHRRQSIRLLTISRGRLAELDALGAQAAQASRAVRDSTRAAWRLLAARARTTSARVWARYMVLARTLRHARMADPMETRLLIASVLGIIKMTVRECRFAMARQVQRAAGDMAAITAAVASRSSAAS